MKKCPYCAEDIQDDAIICRFCNRKVKKASFKILNVLIPALFAALSMYGIYFYLHSEIIQKEQRAFKSAEFQKMKIVAVTVLNRVNDLMTDYRSNVPPKDLKVKAQLSSAEFMDLKDRLYKLTKGAKDAQNKLFYGTVSSLTDKAYELSEQMVNEAGLSGDLGATKSTIEEKRKKAAEYADYYRTTARDLGQEAPKEQAVKLYQQADAEEKALEARQASLEKVKQATQALYQELENYLNTITLKASSMGFDLREFISSPAKSQPTDSKK